MLVGYARTSTTDQQAGLEAQRRDLGAMGCQRLFEEQVSSVVHRAELITAIDYVREGDTLVVTRLDRLARSTADLLGLVSALEAKGVGLRVLDFGGSEIDTKSPSGKMILTMMGAIAEFERSLMLERQREGIAKAKADGRYRGRAPTALAKSAQVLELKAAGARPSDIAVRCNISRSSVHRIIASGGRA